MHVQVADIDAAGAEAVAQEITRQGGAALAVRCDVADVREQRDAFQQHCRRFNRLDYALLNAGIGEQGDMVFGKDGAWQATLDVDLRGVIQGVGLAARAMLTGDPDGNGGGSGGSSKGGVIMITASAGGVYPMPLRCGAMPHACAEMAVLLAPSRAPPHAAPPDTAMPAACLPSLQPGVRCGQGGLRAADTLAGAAPDQEGRPHLRAVPPGRLADAGRHTAWPQQPGVCRLAGRPATAGRWSAACAA